MKSWKTSSLGIAGAVTILINVLIMLFDGDPNTNPDWSVAVPGILSGLGLIAARDNKTSDRKAGA